MNFLKMIIKLGGNMLQYAIINILWITAGIYLSRKLRNGFHILQLEHYKTKPYRQWRKEHLKKVWNPKELLVILPILITCFYFELGIIIEIIFFILLIRTTSRNRFHNVLLGKAFGNFPYFFAIP